MAAIGAGRARSKTEKSAIDGANHNGAVRSWGYWSVDAALEPRDRSVSQHGLCGCCKQIPSAREALELVGSALREFQPGP
jgi:hypothetical protein